MQVPLRLHDHQWWRSEEETMYSEVPPPSTACPRLLSLSPSLMFLVVENCSLCVIGFEELTNRIGFECLQ